MLELSKPKGTKETPEFINTAAFWGSHFLLLLQQVHKVSHAVPQPLYLPQDSHCQDRADHGSHSPSQHQERSSPLCLRCALSVVKTNITTL